MRLRLALALVALSSVSGCLCHSLSSKDVHTSAIKAVLEVESRSTSNATGKAWLEVTDSPNTYLSADAPDQLTFNVDGSAVKLDKYSVAGVTWYSANTASTAEGTSFGFDLERGPADSSAPGSHVTMPAVFTITSPVEGTHYSRAAGPVTLSWSPSGTSDGITLVKGGDCIDTTAMTPEHIVGDTGTQALTMMALSGDAAKSCVVTVTVERIRKGALDPALNPASTFEARQIRQVSFTSDP